ncbi:hypothetical protein D3C80_1551580 [compost metagenome]
MDQVDPVLESVKNVGEVLNEVTLAAKQVSSSFIGKIKNKPRASKAVSDSSNVPAAPVSQNINSGSAPAPASQNHGGWIKWVDIAATLWQKYRA